MIALLLNFMSVGMQYVCSVALVVICAVVGVCLYRLRKRKSDEPHEAEADGDETEPAELAEEPAAETEEEPATEPAEEPAEETAAETVEEPVEEPVEEAAEETSEQGEPDEDVPEQDVAAAEELVPDEDEGAAEEPVPDEDEGAAEEAVPEENEAEEESADESADDDEEEIALPLSDSTLIRGRYNKSFTAKLIQSSDSNKQYYAELANELFAYRKVRNRISWANSSFFAGRKVVSKFAIRGKTLYLYLALDPNDFLDSKYFVTDESAVKRYEGTPLRMKVKSGRGVKFGKELIEILMQNAGVARAEEKVERVTPADYPYDTTENLLGRGLIKLKTEEGQAQADSDGPTDNPTGSPTDSPTWADIEKREQVSAAEVQDLIPDEVAVSLVEEMVPEEAVLSKPKGIINIDTLSENYLANETVTLESLKEKNLIGKSVNHVKVLARGVLNKPLIVKMPEFSVDAVKMILLTGGKALKIVTKKK